MYSQIYRERLVSETFVDKGESRKGIGCTGTRGVPPKRIMALLNP